MKYLFYNWNFKKYHEYVNKHNLDSSKVFYCYTLQDALETKKTNKKFNICCTIIDLGKI